MNALAAFFAHPGRATLAALASIGRVALFTLRALGAAVRPPYYFGRLLEQMLIIGWFSLPVVGLTAVFTGAALAQQIFVGGSRFNAATLEIRYKGLNIAQVLELTIERSASGLKKYCTSAVNLQAWLSGET